MLFDTSYTDKKITKQINEAVGPPFSWKVRWRMGGIGSKRMPIHDISADYRQYLNADHYVSNANIELRPSGIIIHFRHKLQAYSWIMPFAGLEINQNATVTLTSEGKHISFQKDLDAAFISKLLSQMEAFQA